MKVGIAGLGLIGGSLAKAYEKSGAAVYGYDGNRVVQDFAKLQGTLTGDLNRETIGGCDLLLVALYFILPDAVINRFASIGNLGDSSTSYRVYIWMGTLAMLKDYWMCGIGPGDAAFNLVYPKYSYSGIVAPHAHNLFLQIVCDAGVVALVVFVLLLFHYFRDLCAAFCREKDPFSRLYQTAAVSGIAGFLVQAMTDYSFYNYRVLFLFWAWLALGSLLARRGQLPERGLRT